MGKKEGEKKEESLALRRGEVKRGDFDNETCPPADSGSFCEAVGREGLVRGLGWSQRF